MAEGLFTLILFAIAMAAASFGAGMLPLAISLSQSQLRLISTIGMGVLVGTSLIVIIPEGIDTLYSVTPTPRQLKDLHDRKMVIRPLWRKSAISVSKDIQPWDVLDHTREVRVPVRVPLSSRQQDGDNDRHHGHSPEPVPVEGHDPPKEHTPLQAESPAHAYVGLSLISGFILMYLIDQLPKHTLSSPPNHPYHIAIDNLNAFSSPSSISGYDSPNTSSSATITRKTLSTTTGLVIHAAADGIALGASSTSSNLTLEVIIFVAIMLHKAPAAFGLSAVLLRAGLSKRQARGHLIVFSLAAPGGALLTWAVISILGSGTLTKSGIQWWTGMLLLFSGGTFLYVAMHTMQDQAEPENHGLGYDTEVGYGAVRHNKPPLQLRDTVAAVFGMLLPLLTQIGHHHH